MIMNHLIYLRSLGLLNCQHPSFFSFLFAMFCWFPKMQLKDLPSATSTHHGYGLTCTWPFQYNPNWKTQETWPLSSSNIVILIQKKHIKSLKILENPFFLYHVCVFSLPGTYCEAETLQDHSIWPHRIKEAHILEDFSALKPCHGGNWTVKCRYFCKKSIISEQKKCTQCHNFRAPQRKCYKAHHPCPHHLCSKTLGFLQRNFPRLPTFICWNVRLKVDDLKPLHKQRS